MDSQKKGLERSSSEPAIFAPWLPRTKALAAPTSQRARSEAVATLLKTQRVAQHRIPRITMTMCALHNDPTYHAHQTFEERSLSALPEDDDDEDPVPLPPPLSPLSPVTSPHQTCTPLFLRSSQWGFSSSSEPTAATPRSPKSPTKHDGSPHNRKELSASSSTLSSSSLSSTDSPSSHQKQRKNDQRCWSSSLALNVGMVVLFGCAAIVPTELAVRRDRNAMELITLMNYVLITGEAWIDRGVLLLTKRKIPLPAHCVIFTLGLLYNVALTAAIGSGLPMSVVLVLKNTQILSQMVANATCLGERYLFVHNLAALVVVAGVVVVVLTADPVHWHSLVDLAKQMFFPASSSFGHASGAPTFDDDDTAEVLASQQQQQQPNPFLGGANTEEARNYLRAYDQQQALEAEQRRRFYDTFRPQRPLNYRDFSGHHSPTRRRRLSQADPSLTVGIGLMVLANMARAVSNVVTQKAFLSRGNHYVEKLFYEHALGVPVLVLPRVARLVRQARRWNRDIETLSLPFVPAVRVPALWCLVAVQALCTFECTRASARVVGLSSAVTLALALAFQRFASIIFSALFLNTAATSTALWVGACLVVAGVVIYVLAPKPKRHRHRGGDRSGGSCCFNHLWPKAIGYCV